MLKNKDLEMQDQLRATVGDLTRQDLAARLGKKFMRAHLLGATAVEIPMALMTFGLSLLVSLPITGATMLGRGDGTPGCGLKARADKCAQNILNGTGMPLPFPADLRAMTSGFLVGVWQNVSRPVSYGLIAMAAVVDTADVARSFGRNGFKMPLTQSLRHGLWKADMISPSVESMKKLNRLQP